MSEHMSNEQWLSWTGFYNSKNNAKTKVDFEEKEEENAVKVLEIMSNPRIVPNPLFKSGFHILSKLSLRIKQTNKSFIHQLHCQSCFRILPSNSSKSRAYIQIFARMQGLSYTTRKVSMLYISICNKIEEKMVV